MQVQLDESVRQFFQSIVRKANAMKHAKVVKPAWLDAEKEGNRQLAQRIAWRLSCQTETQQARETRVWNEWENILS